MAEKKYRSPDEVFHKGRCLREILEEHRIWLESNFRNGGKADLHEANLERVSLRNVNLTRCNLKGANLSHANLDHIQLRGAGLEGVNLEESRLVGANLLNVNLRGANLKKTFLVDARMQGCTLNRTKLIKTELPGADLTSASIFNAILDSAVFRRTIFDRSVIINTDFSNAIFQHGCSLKEIRIDDFSLETISEEYRINYGFSWTVLDDGINQHKILREITFKPEHKEAGISILSYFSNILKQKYPDTKVSVSITQDDLKVTMAIETPEGEKKLIEKTLDEYGLVVQGEMAPERLLDDPFEVQRLKTHIRFAETQLETYRELLLTSRTYGENRINSLEEDIKYLKNLVNGLLSSNQEQTKLTGEIVKVFSTHQSDLMTFLREQMRETAIQEESGFLRKALFKVDPDPDEIDNAERAALSIREKASGVFDQLMTKLIQLQGNLSSNMLAWYLLERLQNAM